MAIEPMEVIAAKTSTSNNNYGTSNGFQKVLVSVCDQSATSFKVVLWREKANWIYLLKPGDAVLFTGNFDGYFFLREEYLPSSLF